MFRIGQEIVGIYAQFFVKTRSEQKIIAPLEWYTYHVLLPVK